MSRTTQPPSPARALLWCGLLVALAVLASGCTSSQAFRPADSASAHSSSGHLAAEYTLRSRGGPDVGEVRVWSPGAHTDGGSDATVWEVGFEIDNDSEAPLVIDVERVYVDDVRFLGAVLRKLAPLRTEGDRTIAPGSTGTFSATFRLPGVDPRDIIGFRVRWAVRRGNHRWSQRTPFIQAIGSRYGYYYPPYGGPYSPYYYGPYWGPYYYGTYYGPIYGPGSSRRPVSPAGRSRPPSFHPAPPPPHHR